MAGASTVSRVDAVILAIARAEDAPLLLNNNERQTLETPFTHACRNSQAPDLNAAGGDRAVRQDRGGARGGERGVRRTSLNRANDISRKLMWPRRDGPALKTTSCRVAEGRLSARR
jgi:hypothetical protein